MLGRNISMIASNEFQNKNGGNVKLAKPFSRKGWHYISKVFKIHIPLFSDSTYSLLQSFHMLFVRTR